MWQLEDGLVGTEMDRAEGMEVGAQVAYVTAYPHLCFVASCELGAVSASFHIHTVFPRK